MALPPPGLPPERPGARRLADQAAFLGESGRAGKSQTRVRDSDSRSFRALLDEEDPERTPETAAAAAPPDLESQNQDDAERLTREAGEEHAEQHRTHFWPGPHPSMGQAMAAQAALLPTEVRPGKPGRAQGRPELGLNRADSDESTGQVSDALLQALRRSGLAQPVTGFHDPRLRAGAPPALPPEWSSQEVPGARVYRWAGAEARQTLRWSEKDQLLESSAGGQRQVIQKLGEQFWSETTSTDAAGDLPSA